MRILHVVGARPNFIKLSAVYREMARWPEQFQQILVHTGQHYDGNMSDVFFEEMELPAPDVNLGVGSGSHAWQTAHTMELLEPVLLEHKPHWVFVYGDANSALAGALVASKLGLPIAHVEAGLRSFDRSMPEEINRVLTDHLADLLFTPSRDANENLSREGIPPEKAHFVGNVMIDTLVRSLPEAETRWEQLQSRLGLARFVVLTLHRPSNVNDPQRLTHILTELEEIARQVRIIFPVHPRTRQILGPDLLETSGLVLTEPLGYLDFLALQAHAQAVITDSGGIQEETTYLGVPCLTLRPNTERPVTITHGTNRLVPDGASTLRNAVLQVLLHRSKRVTPRSLPDLWDGRAAERLVHVLLDGPAFITAPA